MKENTESVRTSSRGQLYANDTQSVTDEATQASAGYWTIYTHPSSPDPVQKCREWLSLLTTNPDLLTTDDAEKLYNKIATFDLSNAKEDDPQVKEIHELRCIICNLTHILDELHMAYDFWSNNVIETKELDTWLGYVREIGPHPLFLAVISHWKTEHYMSRGFAMMLQDELTRKKEDADVVNYFCSEMSKANLEKFVKDLPDYGNEWSPAYDNSDPPNFWDKTIAPIYNSSNTLSCLIFVGTVILAALWIRKRFETLKADFSSQYETAIQNDRALWEASMEQRIKEVVQSDLNAKLERLIITLEQKEKNKVGPV